MDKIKPALVFIFVLAGVAMILGLWANNLVARGDERPGFYRATLSPNLYLELTRNAAAGTIFPDTGEHKNGSGGGHEATPQPALTPTPTPVEPTEGVDQVN